jgi:hypothetical protein
MQTDQQHTEDEWDEVIEQLLRSDDMQGFQRLTSITNNGSLWGTDLALFVFEQVLKQIYLLAGLYLKICSCTVTFFGLHLIPHIDLVLLVCYWFSNEC